MRFPLNSIEGPLLRSTAAAVARALVAHSLHLTWFSVIFASPRFACQSTLGGSLRVRITNGERRGSLREDLSGGQPLGLLRRCMRGVS